MGPEGVALPDGGRGVWAALTYCARARKQTSNCVRAVLPPADMGM